MILSFDGRGNMIPYRRVEANLETCFGTFVQEFTESLTRHELYENLIQYRIDLFDITDASVSQWLNGSFVTLKSDPEDIDLVNFIPFNDNLDNALEKLIPYFTVGGSMEKYRIDAHLVPVYPESDPRFENTKLRTAYFEWWFGHDRDGYSKGFIEIIEP